MQNRIRRRFQEDNRKDSRLQNKSREGGFSEGHHSKIAGQFLMMAM